ncbi:MAG: DUF2703 domain-containing protein [Thermoanaerobaculia bacterium]
MNARSTAPETPESTHRELEVELLALDLTSCTRCTGTLANIEEAIAAVRRVAEPTGTSIRLRRTLVDSEEAARRHRFVSSPTIRVGGRDVVFETRESLCDSCTDLCGCAEGTSCRVWSYQGREYTEAPVGLVVEALLREMAVSPAGEVEPAVAGDEVPANLRRFFAGRAASGAGSAAACCSTAEQETCCAPSQKASCCAPDATSCGCA